MSGEAKTNSPAAVAAHRMARRAWLVRKTVQHFPDNPCFVLVVDFAFWWRPSQKTLQKMVDALPDGDAVLLLNGARNRGIRRQIGRAHV